ncbi:glutathione S-transferase [Cyanobium sp. PCC 7001]|uniref:glutathione S-transferase C-terminal domain-containing protein n=1 Tax=Cyanobium sp. PCC 7001 TaxID=180281 RepID=UPI00018055AA|nr:glutathione S-transferase C-terminal domain-containing protein [Cyanobium sp. PCC 7001]EDY38902.1 glutathione S-transferase [Cyanobium sp. PCC 7001]
MAPVPPLLVRTARHCWHWQWRQLMGGLAPADSEGNYRRPAGAFTALPPLPEDAAAPDGHVLIVGRSCPWAHRAWLVWSLRRLAGSITLEVVEPDPEAGRWRFTRPFLGCTTLQELYRACGAPSSLRATVPVLVSRHQPRVVVGESARLIELLNQWPSPQPLDLDPAPQQAATTHWREKLQHSVNDGVYRCGFARTQAAYDRAEAALFATLGELEQHLTNRPDSWLSGPQLSLADVQLFPTLIRLELVYAPLFGVSRLPLWQLPALWRWRSRFHGLPGVGDTCDPAAWRQDYFGALFPLHPSGIVPAGPSLATLVGEPPARRPEIGEAP